MPEIQEHAMSRIGLLRVNGNQWSSHEAAIRANLSDGEIMNVLPALQNGQYLNGVDLLLHHPELDEVESTNEKFRRYECEFFPNEDGTVTRGPFVS